MVYVSGPAPGVDPGVKAGPNAAKDGYCIQATVSGQNYSYTGGAGGTAQIVTGVCATATYGTVT